MSKVTAFLLAALFLCVFGSVSNAQVGLIIYTGQSTADLYMGTLTDPNFTKIEFFRGAKKLGEIIQNGPNGGIVTDSGLVTGSQYQYEFRAHRTGGGFVQGAVGGYSFVTAGDIRGLLTRKDVVNKRANLIDSVFIYPGGDFLGTGVIVSGGEMHLAPGADVTYSLVNSKIAGITIYDTGDPQYPPGKFTASGGRLKELNIISAGQVGPLANVTLLGSRFDLNSTYPCVMTKCTLDASADPVGGTYWMVISAPNFTVNASECLIRESSQLIGAGTADKCIVENDASLLGSNISNSEFRSNGQLTLRPADVPTSCRGSKFKGGTSNSSIALANKSVVEFNLMEAGTTMTLNSRDAGFDSADVKGVHINYNHFERDGNSALILSTMFVDTIDVTKNYWGLCNGPYNSERIGRAAHFDPFLRVKYAGTSYWFDMGVDKKTVIADGEDQVVFTGHFWNVLSESDSAGATVDYLVRILGDTLMSGTLTMDANGQCTLPVKVPIAYRTAIAMEVYFKSIQCIDQGYIIFVTEPQGADLEILEASAMQVMQGETSIINNKPFMVKAQINTSEPVAGKFGVRVKVNGVDYDTFYVLDKKNLGVDYSFENPMTEISLPRAESPYLYFPINNTTLNPGNTNIVVTIDPPDATNPKGRVIEVNENNNVFYIPVKITGTTWANEGGANASVFVQPIDGFPIKNLDALTRMADTARSFIEKTWPMKAGQISFERSATVADYLWISPDTLKMETWEYYLMKAYKQMRIANPAHDRYVFSVDRDWFGWRMHPVDFSHRLSQTLSWSGIYDLMVVSAQSHQFLVHSLGHSFGLRRHDMAGSDIDMQEEYYNFFVGKEVYDAVDPFGNRIIHYGINNKVGYLQKAYCFMGMSKTTNDSYRFNTWVCDVDYAKLQKEFSLFRSDRPGFSKGLAAKTIFVEGSVDSTTRAFSFGPWLKLDNATLSNMVDSSLATHVFRFLDGGGAELSRYYYRPTFQALGLDEGADAPFMTKEYFAFVAPFSDNVKKVVVETAAGAPVAERIVGSNAPVVTSDYPKSGDNVPEGGSFIAKWSATDADGDTEFWYTVYFSTDGGTTWQLVTFESKLTEAIIKAAKGMNYKLRIIGYDGILSSETTVTFNILTSTENPSAPGSFVLHQNFPNPFNPSTTLRYEVPAAGWVSVDVFDALGRPVETLFSGYQDAGSHALIFDAVNRPSGTYTAVLRTGDRTATIHMLLSK